MSSGVKDLVQEHGAVSQAWLEAEQERVDILSKLILGFGNKCTMDLPENFFKEYDEALVKAARARRSYVKWLAEQGIASS
jgi:hypothetical protein